MEIPEPDRPLHLSVAADASELGRVREAVRTYATPLIADLDAVVLAAHEAVAYAVVAGVAYELVDGHPTINPIELELRPRGDALEMSVRAPTPLPADGGEPDRDLTPGLRLASALADRIEIRTLEEGSFEIRATFPRLAS